MKNKFKLIGIIVFAAMIGLMSGCDTEEYNISTWTVEFNTNGGSSIAQRQVHDFGLLNPMPENPTKHGFTFAGWFTDSAFTTSFNVWSPITANTTLFARWVDNSIPIVTWEASAVGAPTTTAISFTFSDEVTGLSATDIRFWTFEGSPLTGITAGILTQESPTQWTLAVTVETGGLFRISIVKPGIATGSQQLGINSPGLTFHRVTFNTLGGSSVPPVDVLPGQTVPAPFFAPAKERHLFSDWYTDETGCTQFDFETPITSDTTIYARWLSAHTVTFNTNGGNSIEPRTVAHGSTIGWVHAEREGFSFNGWFSDPALENSWSISTDIVTFDITLYANWIIHVMFEVHGGNPQPSLQTIDWGATATRPIDPNRAGYILAGWFTAQTGGEEWDFDTPITSHITLHAQWTIRQVTVSFQTHGGTPEPLSQTIDWNTTASRPILNPTSTSQWHAFAGWFTAQTGGERWDFDVPITDDIILHAQWVPAPLLIRLSWIRSNAQPGDHHIIEVGENESITSVQAHLPNITGLTITLKGNNTTPGNIQLTGVGTLFSIPPGVTLVLDNVNLRGVNNNNAPLVQVGGTLQMNDGASISGNLIWSTTDYPRSGGVEVLSGGIFNMHSGIISGNRGMIGLAGTNAPNNFQPAGNGGAGSAGGVEIRSGGTFNMHSGLITGNFGGNGGGGGRGRDGRVNAFGPNDHASWGGTGGIGGGGAVNVRNGGTFTMIGGKITENRGGTGGSGGTGGWGVAPAEALNGGNGGGGGRGSGAVNIENNGTFNMTGGEITGNTGGTGGTGGVGGQGFRNHPNLLDGFGGSGGNGGTGGNGGVNGVFTGRSGVIGNAGGAGGAGGNPGWGRYPSFQWSGNPGNAGRDNYTP